MIAQILIYLFQGLFHAEALEIPLNFVLNDSRCTESEVHEPRIKDLLEEESAYTLIVVRKGKQSIIQLKSISYLLHTFQRLTQLLLDRQVTVPRVI